MNVRTWDRLRPIGVLSIVCLGGAIALVARHAPAAPPSGYACGDGKPNVAGQKCDCPTGKVSARNAKDQAVCVDAPKPPPPPPTKVDDHVRGARLLASDVGVGCERQL